MAAAAAVAAASAVSVSISSCVLPPRSAQSEPAPTDKPRLPQYLAEASLRTQDSFLDWIADIFVAAFGPGKEQQRLQQQWLQVLLRSLLVIAI